MQKKIPIWPAIVLALVSLGSLGLKHAPSEWTSWASIVPVSIEGTEVLFVHETQYPTVSEVLALRELPKFCEDNKCRGFTDVDDDSEWAQPILSAVKEKYKIESPFLAAAKVSDGSVTGVVKAVPFKESLQDLKK